MPETTFFRAREFDRSYQQIAKPEHSKQLASAVVAFIQNLDRLAALAEMPALISGIARHKSERCEEIAKLNREAPPEQSAMPLEAFRLVQEVTSPLTGSAREEWIAKGVNDVEVFEMVYRPDLTVSLHAVLSSLVVGAWSAFEVLAGDVWVAAINERANPLAVRWGRDKQVSIAALGGHGNRDFNLTNLMGDVLWDKTDFLSLKSTKFEYQKTFEHTPGAFEDPQLQLLELVRNLIVHNGGTVDNKFERKVTEAGLAQHPDFVGSESEKPFPLDGAKAARFTDAASKGGASLVKFVTAKLWP